MAISASSYSVGNRVYRGGSSAPTQGTVDPMGYIDRGLNNPSQSRSGLAQAALRRLGSRTRGGPAQTGPGASPGGPLMRTMDFQDSNGDGRDDRGTFSSRTGWSGQAKGLGAPSSPGGMNNQPPGLQMSAIGKLQAPDLSASLGGTGLPFDVGAADAQQQLLGRKNRFEQEFTQGQQGLERDYMLQRRSVEDALPDERRNLLENYAGRGLAYSSGYAYDTGDLEGQYANLLAELEGGKTEGLADLLRQRGMFNEDYASQLQAIQAAAARRLSDQAGDLGLNNGAPGAPGGQNILDSLFPKQPVSQPFDERPGIPGVQPMPTITNTPAPAAPVPVAPAPQPTPQPAPISDSFKLPINHRTPTGQPAPVAPRPAPAPAPQPVYQPRPVTPQDIAQAAASQYAGPNNPTQAPSHTNPILRPGDAPTPNSPLQGAQQQQPRSHNRTIGSFDSRSRTTLTNGGTVVGGNGLTYKYDPNTGQAVPVASRSTAPVNTPQPSRNTRRGSRSR